MRLPRSSVVFHGLALAALAALTAGTQAESADARVFTSQPCELALVGPSDDGPLPAPSDCLIDADGHLRAALLPASARHPGGQIALFEWRPARQRVGVVDVVALELAGGAARQPAFRDLSGAAAQRVEALLGERLRLAPVAPVASAAPWPSPAPAEDGTHAADAPASQVLVRYQTDARGRVILKIGDSGLRRYQYDGDSNRVLAEYDESGSAVAVYRWGLADRLIELTLPLQSRRFFFHYDALGSVSAVTDDDGRVVAHYHYDAFGSLRHPEEAAPGDYRFAGLRFEPETGLYNANARQLDPVTGRFITRDSATGRLEDPLTLNPYAYALANPTRYVDPSGHTSVSAALVARAELAGRQAERERLRANAPRFGNDPNGAVVFITSSDLSAVPDRGRGGEALFEGELRLDPGLRQRFEQARGRPQMGMVPLAGTPRDTGFDGDDARVEAELARREATLGALRTFGEVGQAVSQGALSLAAGTAGDVVTLATGLDPVTGEDVGGLGRAMAAAGVILPGLSGRDLKLAREAAESARVARAERLAGSKLEHLNGAIAEVRGFIGAIEDAGHVAIQAPGKVTARGLDFITYDPILRQIVVWDAKYRGPGGRAPTTVPVETLERWLPDVRQAVEAMPSGFAKDAVVKALDAGKVGGRIFPWP